MAAATAAAELSLIKPANSVAKFSRPGAGFATLRPRSSCFRVLAAAQSAAGNATPPKPKSKGKTEIKETLLTPRFYTTDFDEMEQLFNTEMNKYLNAAEFEALLNEFKTDYNQT
ncbi:hypothetical protein, partial [Acinetobacter baumannii]|uniref:hypothetical protein n=1 Tax=Acinetobacter baumannii TaxID=470 RepID=UPI003EBBE852